MKKLFLLALAVISLSSFSTTPFHLGSESVEFRLYNPDLSPIRISVYDTEGRSIFSETLTGQKAVGKIFNFKDALPDTYTIRVVDGDATYIQEVTIK